MPTGTGANVLSTLPEVPYVIDPTTFANLTEKNEQPLTVFATPGPGQQTQFFLPRSGVATFLSLKFIGTLTVAAAGGGQTQPVPSARWPYGFLSGFKLSAGLGAETFDVDGLDLACLKVCDNPFTTPLIDQYPGALGGGGSALAAGTYPIALSYDIPIAVDQTSLIASLFLQSSSATVQAIVQQELMANLVAAGGTSTLWTITGSWYPSLTVWDIPISNKGELILPEINHVHLVVGIDQAITGTGRQPAPVQRTAGVLQRLFLRAQLSPISFLSALPSTPSTSAIDQIQLNYGLTATPLIYNPAWTLTELNNKWYGQPLPYDELVFDTLKQNPARDAILLQGVTNLQAILYVDPAVTVNAGAFTRVVEEILV